jgi:hypothetical protein
MAYRKIVVNDVAYRYVVGKTHTKIHPEGDQKHSKLYLNAEWGTPCIDGGWSYNEKAEDRLVAELPTREPYAYMVAPGDVRGMIVGERKWKDIPCRRHPEVTVTGVCTNPFDAEIRGKRTLVYNCPRCLTQSAYDI